MALLELLRTANPALAVVRALLDAEPAQAAERRDDGSLPLHVACFNSSALSNAELIQLLLERHPPAVSTQNKFGHTPLHKAVCVASSPNHIQSMSLLIAACKESLLTTTIDGKTPLHLSVAAPRVPSVEVVGLLLQVAPRALGSLDQYGQSPLHVAASKSGVSAIATMLIAALPSALAVKDLNGFTPLHWALARSNPDIEVVLALSDAYPRALFEHDAEGCTPLMKFALNPDRNRELEGTMVQICELERQSLANQQLQELAVQKPPSRKVLVTPVGRALGTPASGSVTSRRSVTSGRSRK